MKSINYCQSLIFVNLEVYQYLVGNINQSVSVDNFVKRHEQHERVILELLHFSELQTTNIIFTRIKIKIGISMQFLILLIYDKNRQEGKIKAKEFKNKLKEYNKFWKLTRFKYFILCTLHIIGIDAKKYNMLKNIQKLFFKVR